jgi:hypothetical protein
MPNFVRYVPSHAPGGSFLKKSRHELVPTLRLGANLAVRHRCVGTKVSVGAHFALKNFPLLSFLGLCAPLHTYIHRSDGS